MDARRVQIAHTTSLTRFQDSWTNLVPMHPCSNGHLVWIRGSVWGCIGCIHTMDPTTPAPHAPPAPKPESNASASCGLPKHLSQFMVGNVRNLCVQDTEAVFRGDLPALMHEEDIARHVISMIHTNDRYGVETNPYHRLKFILACLRTTPHMNQADVPKLHKHVTYKPKCIRLGVTRSHEIHCLQTFTEDVAVLTYISDFKDHALDHVGRVITKRYQATLEQATHGFGILMDGVHITFVRLDYNRAVMYTSAPDMDLLSVPTMRLFVRLMCQPAANRTAYGWPPIRGPWEPEFFTVSFLGRGGFGTVFAVTDSADPAQSLLVLKAPLEGLRQVDHCDEVNVLRKLCHPSIPQFITLTSRGELVTRPVGTPINTMLDMFNEAQPGSKDDDAYMTMLACVVWDLYEALCHAHAQGICHCDVTPDNVVVVQSEGRGVLIDWGLAMPTGTHHPGCGVPAFMASGIVTVAPDQDFFSLGLVFIAMLPRHNGNLPWECPSGSPTREVWFTSLEWTNIQVSMGDLLPAPVLDALHEYAVHVATIASAHSSSSSSSSSSGSVSCTASCTT
jgi:hypothetical protein